MQVTEQVLKGGAAVVQYRHKGASCYGDLELAKDACRQGASYVAFGGFVRRGSKKYAVTMPVSIITESKAAIPLPWSSLAA